MRTIVVAGDRQIPHEDKRVCELLRRFLKDLQPEVYIENGDLLDLAVLSKYKSTPDKAEHQLEKQLIQGGITLASIRDVLPHAEIYLIEGNHDFRVRSYCMDHARALYGVMGKALRGYLRLDELDVTYVDSHATAGKWSGVWMQIPKTQLLVGHFNKVSKYSTQTVKGLVEDFGMSVIQNHTHRGGQYFRSAYRGRVFFGIENFCLCKLKQGYSQFNNWQHGFTVLHIVGSRVYPQMVWIQNGTLVYNGRVYKA